MSWVKVVAKALKSLPWKKIIAVVGPLVYEPVKKKIEELIGRIGHPHPPRMKMETRIKELEQIQAEQTTVLSQMEDQIRSLDETLQAVSARSMIFGIVSIVSLITSIAVLIVVLLK